MPLYDDATQKETRMQMVGDNHACLDCGKPTGKPFARYCDEDRWKHRGKKRVYRLSAEAEAYLRTHYKAGTKGSAKRIAVVLQVPRWRVCKWAAELGLTTGVYRKNSRNWTRDEDALLEASLGKRHVNWIAKRLERSVTAVVVRAKRLRLSRLPDGYSQQDVALAFGVSRDTVERWGKQGWLTSAFVPSPGQPFRYTDEDVLRFIDAHRNAFEIGKCDQAWLLGLLLDADVRTLDKKRRAA